MVGLVGKTNRRSSSHKEEIDPSSVKEIFSLPLNLSSVLNSSSSSSSTSGSSSSLEILHSSCLDISISRSSSSSPTGSAAVSSTSSDLLPKTFQIVIASLWDFHVVSSSTPSSSSDRGSSSTVIRPAEKKWNSVVLSCSFSLTMDDNNKKKKKSEEELHVVSFNQRSCLSEPFFVAASASSWLEREMEEKNDDDHYHHNVWNVTFASKYDDKKIMKAFDIQPLLNNHASLSSGILALQVRETVLLAFSFLISLCFVPLVYLSFVCVNRNLLSLYCFVMLTIHCQRLYCR
jgi:hypothetical protein